MKRFDNKEEYEDFVETLAKKSLEYNDTPAEEISQVVITCIEVIDEENATMLFNGEPYTKTRTTPSEVLLQTVQEADPSNIRMGFRESAVNLLAVDIEEAKSRLRNE